MSFSDDDSEFSIVVQPKKAGLAFKAVESSVTEPTGEAIKPELNPVWVDDNDNTDVNNAVLRQSTILDIHTHFGRKKQQISGKTLISPDDVEKLYDVVSKDNQNTLDYDTQIFRLSDANMERLSCAPLTSVEFNNPYKMFLTTSEDTTMALFKFGKNESTLLTDCVFERFPLSCAKFTAQGDRVILVAKKHYFKVYDMATSKVTHPKIPFGTEYGECVSSVQISPQNDIGAFLGSYGIYIVDLRSYEKTSTARVSGSAVSHCFAKDGNLLNIFASKFLRKNIKVLMKYHDDQGNLVGALFHRF
ncbi:unnamed protein product [Hymenolepis diminuta]|uniref:WD_REPEATS_REGION domain-containing protein n=1 Tax=Hymenolepis diminuta TaxID=6216 RepID=A0A0R3SDH4_HYMDI|nr:unnamed protein product [Hymenolepis diminuta]